jgi:hypothetical protein
MKVKARIKKTLFFSERRFPGGHENSVKQFTRLWHGTKYVERSKRTTSVTYTPAEVMLFIPRPSFIHKNPRWLTRHSPAITGNAYDVIFGQPFDYSIHQK